MLTTRPDRPDQLEIELSLCMLVWHIGALSFAAQKIFKFFEGHVVGQAWCGVCTLVLRIAGMVRSLHIGA